MDLSNNLETQPLSYKVWSLSNPSVNPKQSFYRYNQYLKDWYSKSNIQSQLSEKTNTLRQTYLDLLQKIQIFFSEEDIEKWYTSIDLNSEVELIISIPYFSRKLKDIALFYREQRKEIKGIKTKTEFGGTNVGLSKIVYDYILTAFTKKNYSVNVAGTRFYKQIPELKQIANNLKISVEELYDTHNYFDLAPDVPVTNYFDVSGSKTLEFTDTNNFSKEDIEWLYSTGINSDLFNDLNEILKQKYLGSASYDIDLIKTATSKLVTVSNQDLSLKTGTTLFYWTTSFTNINPNFEIISAPIPINKSDFTTIDAGEDITFASADKLYKITKLDVEGAWLLDTSKQKLQTYMVAYLPVGKSVSFRFPHPGYGLIGEELDYTGPSLVDNTQLFQTLEPDEKNEVLRRYWSSFSSATAFDPIYLQNIRIYKSNSSEKYSDADKMLISNTQGDTDNSHKEFWSYAANKTDLSIAQGDNKFYWPLFKLETTNPVVPFKIPTDWCNPIVLSSVKISEATAGRFLGEGDTILKLTHYNDTASNAVEVAWLSSQNLRNYFNRFTKTADGPKQPGFNGIFETGKFTPFIWNSESIVPDELTGEEVYESTPLSAVFKNVEHSLDCAYLQTTRELARPSVLTPTTENKSSFKECTCRATYYSPLGHPGQTFVDYENYTDFIIVDDPYFSFLNASNGFPQPINMAEWLLTNPRLYSLNIRGLCALSAQFLPYYKEVSATLAQGASGHTLYFTGSTFVDFISSIRNFGINNMAWYQLTPNNTDVGWNFGNWVDYYGNPTTLQLSAGARYYYYRSNLKRDPDDEDSSLPYYVPRYLQTNSGADTIWVKAVLSADGIWRSANVVSDMVIRPGDYIIYNHKNTYTVTYSGASATYVIEPTSANIGNNAWVNYDYVSVNTPVYFNVPNTTYLTDYSGQYSDLNQVEYSRISAVDWEIELINPPPGYSKPTKFNFINTTNIPRYTTFLPFTPTFPGIYRAKATILHANATLSAGQLQTVVPNNFRTILSAIPPITLYNSIPAVTCVPQERKVPANAQKIIPKANFMLNLPLSGWDVCNYKVLSTAPNSQPYWAESVPPNGLLTFNNNFGFIDGYNLYTQPQPTTKFLSGGQVITYTNIGKEVINWIQPLQYTITTTTNEWKKIEIVLDKKIPLTENSNYAQYLTDVTTAYPSMSASNMVIEQTNAGELVKYVYVTQKPTFTFSPTISTINPAYYFASGENVEAVSSLAVTPQVPQANYLNRHYPTIASFNNIETLQTHEDLGGYFTHKNLGILTYASNNVEVVPTTNYDGSNLSGTAITETRGVTDRGLSKKDLSGSFVYNSYNSDWLKEPSFVSTSLTDPKVLKKYQKFLGYQSKYETLPDTNTGLVTPVTKQDPWRGPTDSDWIGTSNYKPDFRGLVDVEAWKNDQILKLDDHKLYKWTTDIYGNQYSVYKKLDNVPISDHKNIVGSLWVKNILNEVKPANLMLSSVFVSYKNVSFYDKLVNNEVLDVEVYYDTLYILLEVGLLLLKLDYDYDTGEFRSNYSESNYTNYEDEQGAIQIEQNFIPTGILLQNVDFPPIPINSIAPSNLLVDKYGEYLTYWVLEQNNELTIDNLFLGSLSGSETIVSWGDSTTDVVNPPINLYHKYNTPFLRHSIIPGGILSGVRIQTDTNEPVTIIWGDGTADFNIFSQTQVNHTFVYSATITTTKEHYLQPGSKFRLFRTPFQDIEYQVVDTLTTKSFAVSGILVEDPINYLEEFGRDDESKPFLIGLTPISTYTLAKSRSAILHTFNDYRYAGSWFTPENQKVMFCYFNPILVDNIYASIIPIIYVLDLETFSYTKVFPEKTTNLDQFGILKNIYITEITSSSFAYNSDSNTGILTIMANVQPRLSVPAPPFSRRLSKVIEGVMINFYIKQFPEFSLQDIDVIYPGENVVLLQENGNYLLQETFIPDYFDDFVIQDNHFIEVEQ